ncbi:PREDICTED: 14-3-3 protein zeta-like [Diuraphis noxia]|uniref:14-3-3 protein zeta-like n=1 Tax=Diuraphis noxia TaxID=143948 RepID=UPI0007639F57|nr:PREDICTED: 14-3-3 protein zeta-like [Diuraphis noxia]
MNVSLMKAKTSMALGQYKTATKYFKAYIDENPHIPLNKEVLNQLHEAYNHLSNDKLKCVLELESYLELLQDSDQERIVAITSLLDETRNDLIAICTEVVNIVNTSLLVNVEDIREKVLIYNMKGLYCRYTWEANNSDATCIVTTKAFEEAMSLCQWNFEPSDPYLLHIAFNLTTHLNNANDTDMAIVILKRVIQNAQENDLENYDFSTKSYIELFLKYLNECLARFQMIQHQKLIEAIERMQDHLPQDSLYDDVITRRRG